MKSPTSRVRTARGPLLRRGLLLGTAVGVFGCDRAVLADTSVLDSAEVAESDASGADCNVRDWVDDESGLQAMEQELGLSALNLMLNVAGLWTGRAARYRVTVDADDYEDAPMSIDIEGDISARVGYPHAGADFDAPGCHFTVRSGGPATLRLADFEVTGPAELSVSCDTADCGARVIAQVLWPRDDATGDEWAVPEADLYALSGRLENGRWLEGRTSWTYEVSVGGSPAMAFHPHLVGWWVRDGGP